ncbi:MAG: hypothetical protein IBX45_12425 [Campylobacterales bacterium]|nr:hypothetical protein [Campylobacterales bacterium]
MKKQSKYPRAIYIKHLGEKTKHKTTDAFGNEILKDEFKIITIIRDRLKGNKKTNKEESALMMGELLLAGWDNLDKEREISPGDGYVYAAGVGGATRGAIKIGALPGSLKINTSNLSDSGGRTIQANFSTLDYVTQVHRYIGFAEQSRSRTAMSKKQALIAFFISRGLFTTSTDTYIKGVEIDFHIEQAEFLYRLMSQGDPDATILILKIMEGNEAEITKYLMSIPGVKKYYNLMQAVIDYNTGKSNINPY